MSMAQQQYQVEHSSGVCVETGRKLDEGEVFHTVLIEDGESFRRADYSVQAWKGPPEGAYCHYKAQVAVKAKKQKLLVNDDLLSDFFTRLADEQIEVRLQFRFVLALILMRKRKLRYDSSADVDDRELWTMTLIKDQTVHQVLNPHLTDDQIEGVSQQLTAILHGDMGEYVAALDQANMDEASSDTSSLDQVISDETTSEATNEAQADATDAIDSETDTTGEQTF